MSHLMENNQSGCNSIVGFSAQTGLLSKSCEKFPRNKSKIKSKSLIQTSLDKRSFWSGPKGRT